MSSEEASAATIKVVKEDAAPPKPAAAEPMEVVVEIEPVKVPQEKVDCKKRKDEQVEGKKRKEDIIENKKRKEELLESKKKHFKKPESSSFHEKNEKFQFGNYNQYYGYR